MAKASSYVVDGVVYPRPFKIRRLGHFGFNVGQFEASADFYGRLLGFRMTDDFDIRDAPGMEELVARLENTRLVFMTHNADHHAFVLAHRSLGAMFGDDEVSPEITLNQISWQVNSLREVMDAEDYLRERGVFIRRMGRDMPGSNWHCYARDHDGHTIELYYGMEQIGWNGRSKPYGMHDRRFDETPPLPQISEAAEAANAAARGVDLHAGYARADLADAGGARSFDVGGVLLPRPFKVVGVGPVKIFVADLDAAEAFYCDVYGFKKTEETVCHGHRCVFLRAGAEHHSLALFPRALRETLGLSSHSSCASVGIQLGGYSQLRNARDFLREQNVRFIDLPPELSPGVDYSLHVLDPEGQCLQLFFEMEQVGWDGAPRPTTARRQVQPGAPWPETLPAREDTYADAFMGPLG